MPLPGQAGGVQNTPALPVVRDLYAPLIRSNDTPTNVILRCPQYSPQRPAGAISQWQPPNLLLTTLWPLLLVPFAQEHWPLTAARPAPIGLPQSQNLLETTLAPAAQVPFVSLD